MRLLVRLLINAVALWLTTIIVTGVKVVPFAPGETLQIVLTYLLVAAIFGLVNGIIGNLIRIVAFPIYVLTLGLISLLVNGLLLLIVHWISSLIGWLIGIILRPIMGGERSR
jgi:putative membrane protein